MSDRSPETDPRSGDGEITLPSGRSLAVRGGNDGGDESIEIRSPDGQLELTVKLTDDGPVLSLKAAAVNIDAAKSVSLRCEDLDIEASKNLRLGSKGEVAIESGDDIRVRSVGQTFIDGEYVNLNCLDGSEDDEQAEQANAPELPVDPQTDCGGGCGHEH